MCIVSRSQIVLASNVPRAQKCTKAVRRPEFALRSRSLASRNINRGDVYTASELRRSENTSGSGGRISDTRIAQVSNAGTIATHLYQSNVVRHVPYINRAITAVAYLNATMYSFFLRVKIARVMAAVFRHSGRRSKCWAFPFHRSQSYRSAQKSVLYIQERR